MQIRGASSFKRIAPQHTTTKKRNMFNFLTNENVNIVPDPVLGPIMLWLVYYSCHILIFSGLQTASCLSSVQPKQIYSVIHYIKLYFPRRIMFGTSHLYVFSNPTEAKRLKDEGKTPTEVTYELAQTEIAKNSGMSVQTKSSETLGKWLKRMEWVKNLIKRYAFFLKCTPNGHIMLKRRCLDVVTTLQLCHSNVMWRLGFVVSKSNSNLFLVLFLSLINLFNSQFNSFTPFCIREHLYCMLQECDICYLCGRNFSKIK